MFHHFHDNNNHISQQGSISADQYASIILRLKSDDYSIISPSEYIYRTTMNTLGDRDLVLTFDDALSCQSAIAIPVLNSFNIHAFFFVYSSAFFKNQNLNFEVLRDFRHRCFLNIDDFYDSFFVEIDSRILSDCFNRVNTTSYLADNIILV